MLKEERGKLPVISMTEKMDDVSSLLAQSMVGILAMDAVRRISMETLADSFI